MGAVYGQPPVFARSGGTVSVGGSGLGSDRAHSPNEKFDLANYYRGVEVSAALLKEFAVSLRAA